MLVSRMDGLPYKFAIDAPSALTGTGSLFTEAFGDPTTDESTDR